MPIHNLIFSEKYNILLRGINVDFKVNADFNHYIHLYNYNNYEIN